MSFDTTARQRVAPGAEEQEMPACLPMVSFLGDERAAMHHETKAGITFNFRHEDRDEAPYVVVNNVPGIPGVHVYHAASFMTAAAEGRAFIISPNWDDQEPITLSRDDVQAVAKMVRDACDRKRGYYEMKWVALDPSMPF